MSRYPDHASELWEPCTRKVVAAMLRNRGYQLHETRYKKDKGLVRVYMFDRWADPMMFLIGEYWDGEEPDWAMIYDAAIDRHLETKAEGTRYGISDDYEL